MRLEGSFLPPPQVSEEDHNDDHRNRSEYYDDLSRQVECGEQEIFKHYCHKVPPFR